MKKYINGVALTYALLFYTPIIFTIIGMYQGETDMGMVLYFCTIILGPISLVSLIYYFLRIRKLTRIEKKFPKNEFVLFINYLLILGIFSLINFLIFHNKLS